MRAHLHALRREPLSYAQAFLWRVRRLRLRSQQHFATLLGRTAVAYDLWLEQERAGVVASTIPNAPLQNVWCVIDCRCEKNGWLPQTLSSVAYAGWQAVLIGQDFGAEVPTVAEPGELVRLAGADSVQWLCVMRPGDRLSPRVAQTYGSVATSPATILYADDDLIDDDQRRREPHFKPGWNPELFTHHDYLTGSCLIPVCQGELRNLPAEGWAEVLLARRLGRGASPVHVPEVLHHRRARPSPCVPTAQLRFANDKQPSMSVIIPTRNQAVLLRNCLDGIRTTAYAGLQIVIVDNGSDEEDAVALLRQADEDGAIVLRRPGKFNFSALNNQAVEHARGDLLCFLNNDVETLSSDWLETLAVQAVRDEIGAVGARLLYPDGSIQHAGVVIGMGGAAGHAHRGERADLPGFFKRTHLPQQVSAVTAACLVVSRAKFQAVGGFDEHAFPVAFNDVDLCLRLNERGWQSFYEPRATLVHHESKSRGRDFDPIGRARFAGELAALRGRWHTDAVRDPYHHPSLSRATTSFVLDL